MKLLFLIIFSSFFEASATQERWQKLMHLVDSEMKILKSARKKTLDMEFRLLELHSEKLKLIHEKNNLEFLNSTKSSAGKENFFKETRAYYYETKNYGDQLLAKCKDSHLRADVLFTMGLNSRDYGTDKITEEYLSQAINLVRNSDPSVLHHARTALADYFYNEKRYHEAIQLYEKVVLYKNDDWLTKHLFNLSWCYLKSQRFDLATNSIRESYRLSLNSKYVNIKDQVLDNIGAFYVYAGSPLEGLNFYIKNEEHPIPYLFKLARITIEKGHKEEARVILDQIQTIIKNFKLLHLQEELYHTYLDFYRQYSLIEDHQASTNNLVRFYLEIEANPKNYNFKINQKEEAIDKIRSLAGFLQVRLRKDIKEVGGSYRESDLNMVLKYFDDLIRLDPKSEGEFLYFQAETLFSVKKYSMASEFYKKAIRVSEKQNLAFAKKALDSMLALTSMEVLAKDANLAELIFTYATHIRLWPREEKSLQMYTKLFTLYMESKNLNQATALIDSYNKAYPEKLIEQQKQMTVVLDYLIEVKDTHNLALWSNRFKSGYLSFDEGSREKLDLTLGNLLFMEYLELSKKGDKLLAAKGFESIFENKLYPSKVKSLAAYHSSLNYIQMALIKDSLKWMIAAYELMDAEEKEKKKEEILAYTERLYKLQDFEASNKASVFQLNQRCDKKDAINSRLFEVAIMTSLIEEKPHLAIKAVRDFPKCLSNVALIETANKQIFYYFEKRGNFWDLKSFFNMEKLSYLSPIYLKVIQDWYWETYDLNLKDAIFHEVQRFHDTDSKEWIQEVKFYLIAKKSTFNLVNQTIWNEEVFSIKKFNQNLDLYLKEVQGFKEKYGDLLESKRHLVVLQSAILFSNLYDSLSNKIRSINPLNMPEDIKAEFVKAMNNLSLQFSKLALQQKESILTEIRVKEVFSEGNRELTAIDGIPVPVFSFNNGLTMDYLKD